VGERGEREALIPNLDEC